MSMDPLAIRALILRGALAIFSAFSLGLVPTCMRGGAKRADPSLAAALFALFAFGFAAPLPFYAGTVRAFLSINVKTLFLLLGCGFLTAFLWLCLFTALTGAGSAQVTPVFALWYLAYLVPAHFLFGAPLGVWKLCCMVLILLGTVLILSRASGGGKLWVVYALLALLGKTALSILEARLTNALDAGNLFASRALVACALLWIFVLLRGRQRSILDVGARAWVALPLGGAFLAASVWSDHFAAQMGDVSAFMPVSVLAYAVMLLSARIFSKEKLTGSMAFGMLLVLIGLFAIRMGL